VALSKVAPRNIERKKMASRDQIVFPKFDVPMPTITPLPKQELIVKPANLGPVSAAISDTRAEKCYEKLQLLPNGQALYLRAQTDAKVALPRFLNEPKFLSNYGTQAVEELNALVRKLRDELPRVGIPELNNILNKLRKDMNGLTQKYDLSNPDVKRNLEETYRKAKTLLFAIKSVLDDLLNEARTFGAKVDRIGEQVYYKQQLLFANVEKYDQLYKEFEEEKYKLLYVISVMEIAVEIAAKTADQIPNDGSDYNEDQRKMLSSLIKVLNGKIVGYRTRFFLGKLDAPQILEMREQAFQLSDQVGNINTLYIPLINSLIVLWVSQMTDYQAALFTQSFNGAFNALLVQRAINGEEMSKEISNAANTPTLLPETVVRVFDSFARNLENIIQSNTEGAKKREELFVVMDDTEEKLQTLNETYNQKMVADIVARISQNNPE
jgi:uncharacterized protein YaaN involved in tellurite resistance